MADFGQRQDLYRVQVILTGTDGKKCKFVFDKMTGGKSSAKVTKYRAANGTENEQLLGGPKTVSDITVTALLTYAMYEWITWMHEQDGKAQMNVNKQPLDTDGNPYGKALTYVGMLSGVDAPDTDSESETAAMLALTCVSATTITSG